MGGGGKAREGGGGDLKVGEGDIKSMSNSGPDMIPIRVDILGQVVEIDLNASLRVRVAMCGLLLAISIIYRDIDTFIQRLHADLYFYNFFDR